MAVAGLVLLLFVVASSIFSLFNNARFFQDAFDLVYYTRFTVIIVGGFLIGLLFRGYTKKALLTGRSIFTGISYGLLAFSTYFLFDMIRLPFNDLIFGLPFPYAKFVFEGMPLLALVAVFLVALCIKRSNKTDFVRNKIFISSLMIAFFGTFIAQRIQLLILASTDWTSALTFSFSSIVFEPVSIAIIVFIMLISIKPLLDRFMYSILIGLVYSASLMAFWEFRTDAGDEATNRFGLIASIVTLSIVAILTGVVYLQSKKK